MYNKPLFTIFGQGVYLYGICFAVGLIACFAFLYITMTKRKFNDKSITVILFIGMGAAAFGIFSAALFQAIYDYIENPAGGFDLESGLTFLGGLVGGVLSYLVIYNVYIYLIAPHTKIKALKNDMNGTLSDALPVIPIGIAIAHGFGRIGCFFSGCCHGAISDAWYALPCSKYYVGQNVVPLQLFESAFLFILAAVMIVLYFKCKFNCNMGVYAIAYGIWRFVLEFFRGDPRGEFVSGLTPSQFWCILMVVCGIAYFFIYKYLLKKRMKHPELSVKNENAALVPQKENT